MADGVNVSSVISNRVSPWIKTWLFADPHPSLAVLTSARPSNNPRITERVAPDTYVAFHGPTTITVESPVSSISTPFLGWIDYCVNPTMGARYDCTPGPAVTRIRCDSARHQLTLTRR